MAMDWVPCSGYELRIAVPPGEQFDMGLLDITTWSDGDEIVGNIEESTKAYKILRIIGYWTASFDPASSGPAGGTVGLRLWPGFQQQAGGAGAADIITPGWIIPAGGITATDTARVANEKFWWERLLGGLHINQDDVNPWHLATDPYNHPWTFMVDIKPRQWIGPGEVPVWSIQNETDIDIYFRHRFRMLVAH